MAQKLGFMHPGPRIKALRRDRGWNLEQLAQEIEPHLGRPVNTGNLSRLERERQGYSNDFLQAVAKALAVPVAELFENAQDLATVQESASAYHQGAGSSSGSIDAPTIGASSRDALPIPRLDVRASMGLGEMRPGHDAVIGNMQLSLDWIRRNLPDISSPRNLRLITGYGDSMEGTFHDGDILFVDTGVHEVRIDAVYAFSMGDELFIKTLQRLPGGALKVISDNKKYEPYVIDQATKDNLAIMGRVVYAWRGRKL